MATDKVKRAAVTGIWEATEFTAGDDTPFVSVEEVAATVSLSAQHGSTRLFGVTLQGDTEKPPKVICYTGNGPRSEAHAHAIVLAVNCHEELVEQLIAANDLLYSLQDFFEPWRELTAINILRDKNNQLISKAEPKP